MARYLLALAGVVLFFSPAGADEIICLGGRCSLPRVRAILAPPSTTVIVESPRVVEHVVEAPRYVESAPPPSSPAGVTVVAPQARRVTVSSGAQSHADRLAATGITISRGAISQRHHASGVGREGLGFSTRSPGDAVRCSCFYGQFPIREQATAWCPSRRGWVAVVRYH